MSRIPLNRSNAPKVISLFDYCFKKGVIDSCDMRDNYYLTEFLNRHKINGTYGLVDDDEDFDWRRWLFIIDRWCREARLSALSDGYLNSRAIKQHSKNFLFAVIPMSMRFYLMGVQEWLEYPSPVKIELFKSSPKTHWKPMPKHMEKMSKNDFLSYLQEFAYEKKKLEIPGDLKPGQYNSFVTCLWDLTTAI